MSADPAQCCRGNVSVTAWTSAVSGRSVRPSVTDPPGAGRAGAVPDLPAAGRPAGRQGTTAARPAGTAALPSSSRKDGCPLWTAKKHHHRVLVCVALTHLMCLAEPFQPDFGHLFT